VLHCLVMKGVIFQEINKIIKTDHEV
jgi:hypothetical protein